MDDFERELKLGFLDEASQALADTEKCFMDLENNPSDTETLNKIFRLAHNLKGSSKAVGFDAMGAFTHEFETFILKVKNGEIPSTAQTINLLLRCNDFLTELVAALKVDFNARLDGSALLSELENPPVASAEPEPENSTPMEENSAVFDEQAESPLETAPATAQDTVPSEPHAELQQTSELELATESQTTAADEAISTITEETEPLEVAVSLPQIFEAPKPSKENHTESKTSEKVSAAKAGQPEESIRVAITKVEQLLNFVGEMVILQSVMHEQVLSTKSLLLKKTVHQLGKVSKEIQHLSMSLRMVPVKPTFQKMQRIVRDTAQALGKDVGITLIGEETELDKTVLEKINDPLVHLMRNSVDHGIEPAEKRKAAGKPVRGAVSLAAFHRSGKLVIEVKDDGGGLQSEKLIKKAKAKGLIKADAVLTENEAFNLIFAPGLSTNDQVTDVSGRGVGMDVVKTNIKELGGEIQIESKLGEGTTFRILLPLTLAIIEGMIINYGSERYVMPLNHVFETLRPSSSELQQSTGLGTILMLRGENMPAFRLGDFFGRKSKLSSDQMIAMVVRSSQKPFALLVDDIIGQNQVVVKSLGPEMQGFKGVSGGTILGDGKPALILEPVDLVKRKHNATNAEPQSGGKAA